MKNILETLKLPFPDSSDWRSILKSNSLVGLFVAGFLFIFKPFGADSLDTFYLLKIALLFGLVSGVVGILYELLVVYVFKIKQDLPSWVFWKWILFTIGLLIMITLANYLLNRWILQDSSINNVWTVFKATISIGIFPIVFIGAVNLVRAKNNYEDIADTLDNVGENSTVSTSEKIVIPELNMELDSHSLLFVEAMQNYVSLYYLDADNNMQKQVVRATMKSLESHLPVKNIIRCHRSYIVNKLHIKKYTGNAQGLILHLDIPENEIRVPVSRKYVDLFRV